MRVDERVPAAGDHRRDRGRRMFVATALAVAVGLGGVTPGGAPEALASSPAAMPGGGDSPAYEVRTCEGGSVGLTAPEYESLQLHNEAREGAGLGHLCVNPTLTEAARGHAADMLERDYFSHYSPEGTNPIDRMEAEGYSGWNAWGENIAWGSGYKGDSKEIFGSLMNSPGHRENILKDGFLEVGIGAVGGEYNGNAGAGMYAMDFGARSGQAHEYPEVLSENGGGANDQAPAEDPLAGQPAGGVTPEDQEGTDPVEPQPEPGESPEEEQREVADAQQAVCEIFGETRERVIGDLRADASEAAQAGEEGPASQIIAETKTNIADQFEASLLKTSFCDFGEDSGGDEGTPEESASPEATSPESASPESASPESTDGSAPAEGTGESTNVENVENVEQTTIVQQNSGETSGGEGGQSEVDAEEIRRQVERDVQRALASPGAMPGAR